LGVFILRYFRGVWVKGESSTHDPNIVMLVHTDVPLDLLARQGKKFNWKKPTVCPRCDNCSLWGHGFVLCFLAGYKEGIHLKRYRCFLCRLVVTMKPLGFPKYYRSAKTDIYKTLKYRLCKLKWPDHCSRQRGGNWLRRFISRVRNDFQCLNPERHVIAWLTYCSRKNIPFLA